MFWADRRIYTLAAIKGNVTLHNLGLAEPSDYYYSLKERYIRRNTPPGIAEFYMVGTVMLSSLLGGAQDRNRQLCIRPMWEQLGRGTAFIGALLKRSAYYVSTFRDGISFSSMFPPKSKLSVFCHRTLVIDTHLSGGYSGERWQPKNRYGNNALPFTPPGIDSSCPALHLYFTPISF